MGASAVLRTPSLSVDPGATAVCDLVVRNTGTVVDEFTFDVRGTATSWTTVEPDRLSLFPGAEGTVQVRFSPPRTSTTPAGPVPYAVVVMSREDPEGKSVEEGVIEVGGFTDVTCEITPRTSRGSLGGKHQLAIDNRGNSKLHAALEAFDPDNLLRIDLRPPSLEGEPGTASFSRLRVRPKKRFLRGQPETRPFQVVVHPDAGEPIPVQGTYLQEPLVPKWIPKALAALVGLAGALAISWVSLVKPAVNSQAKDEVQKLLGAATTGSTGTTGGPTTGSAGQATATPTATTGGTTSTGKPTVVVKGSKTVPTDGRLTKSSKPVTVKGNELLSITDLLLQNPQGETGTLQLRRLEGSKTTTLLDERLENFRDLDYHFVTALQIDGPGELQVLITCTDAQDKPLATCSSSVYYAGTLTTIS
jgi:hypothetical protein